MAAGNGQPPYKVSIPPHIRARFGPWADLAKRAGLFAEFVADLKLLDRNLLYRPVAWGDPLNDLPKSNLKMFRGMTECLLVIYAVHQVQPHVIVKDIVLRPDRPLGQAEAGV